MFFNFSFLFLHTNILLSSDIFVTRTRQNFLILCKYKVFSKPNNNNSNMKSKKKLRKSYAFFQLIRLNMYISVSKINDQKNHNKSALFIWFFFAFFSQLIFTKNKKKVGLKKQIIESRNSQTSNAAYRLIIFAYKLSTKATITANNKKNLIFC